MNPFALFAPLFLGFEVWQLVIAERYLGVRQIRTATDPRTLPMTERRAAFWAGGLLLYAVWMLTLLAHPVGRAQGVVLLAVTALGYTARAATNLKWTLVLLTFEGAIRIGMLISLLGMSWRALLH